LGYFCLTIAGDDIQYPEKNYNYSDISSQLSTKRSLVAAWKKKKEKLEAVIKTEVPCTELPALVIHQELEIFADSPQWDCRLNYLFRLFITTKILF